MIYRIILLVICSALYTGAIQAQDNAGLADQDGSREQAEQAEAREDAYRKRMELEGSRDPDSFANTTYSSQTKQEKIDKLPKESRDNIRDQLMDVIIENGQWEPFDALREYPYEPSESAQENPGLRDGEEEAWAEQMEKYHQREASAFAASRPSMPGTDAQQADGSPGSSGQLGQQQSEQNQSQAGADGEGEQQGDNQGGEGESQNEGEQQGSQDSSSSSASSYDPYQSQQNDDADEISTAGVSESALDFLRAQQAPGSGSPGQAAGTETATAQQEVSNQTGENSDDGAENEAAASQQNDQDSPQQSASGFIIPGTIAIKDLDKLEGLAEPEDDSENQ
ncbi:MAG: hypothetical protein V3R56_09835 [Xanthomonadales bacterium]